MLNGNYSDLPEYYATPPRRIPPVPPALNTSSSSALVPLRRPSPKLRDSSNYSTNSRQSLRVSPPSLSSSRTSLGVTEQHRDHINIGIDFGTTFSGVSWAVSGSQSINTIDNWPNGAHVKVPTVLSYAPDGSISWGYAVSPGTERLSWFKLLLAEEHLPESVQMSKHLTATRNMLSRLGKKVEEVTADYLERLWNYALAEIKRQIPGSFDGMPIRIVLGMPANWPLNAQEKMRRAASRAGMLNRRAGGLVTALEFVAEPEAAAVAAFYEGNIQHNVEIGDTVVICDAGGGTVDIVTYEVTRVKPSVTLSESISGGMALCGSIFLDENFLKYMEDLIGKDRFPKISKAHNDELMDIWEHKVKRLYQNDRSEMAPRIPHPVAKAIDRRNKYSIRRGSRKTQLNGDILRFSSADIEAIFDPVMKDILKLALEQRNEIMRKRSKKPAAILLVGGLGGNKLLYERFKAEFSARDVVVLQPSGPNVWASICRGGAIKSMGYDDFNDDLPFPVVTSYISKAHYGMAFKEPYDSSKHTEQDRKEYDEVADMDLVWDQMSWYVKKGDDVSKGDPVELTWEFKQPESRARKHYNITIFECTTQDAPPRKTSDVRECINITFTASGNTASSQEGPEGRNYRVVRFDVRMTLLGMGKVDFALYVNGRLAAQKDVKVTGNK